MALEGTTGRFLDGALGRFKANSQIEKTNCLTRAVRDRRATILLLRNKRKDLSGRCHKTLVPNSGTALWRYATMFRYLRENKYFVIVVVVSINGSVFEFGPRLGQLAISLRQKSAKVCSVCKACRRGDGRFVRGVRAVGKWNCR